MKKLAMILIEVGAVIALSSAAAQAANLKAEIALRAAMEQETVKGDLKAAIEQYNRIVATYAQDRSVAARALLHIAKCYEKLGESQAQGAYERIMRDYPEQKEAIEARARLETRDSGRRSEAGPVLERVWAAEDAGKDYWGTVSAKVTPGGDQAVFTDWKNGDLSIRNLKTGETRFLTKNAGANACRQDLLFSADGSHIAYRCAGQRNPQPVRMVRLDGRVTHERAITEIGVLLFAWSPDGKQIGGVQYNPMEKTRALVLISASNGSVTRLKSTEWGVFPKAGGFSPDNRFLVYSVAKTSSNPMGGLFAIAVDGSREATLVQSAADYADPTWTPDGKGVVFLSDRSGTKNLWFIRVVDGRPQGEPELLRSQVGAIALKGISRDGSLYYGTNQVDSDLYQIEFDPQRGATVPKRISDRLIGSNHEPEPSPDGKLLAFFRGEPGSRALTPATLVIRTVANGEEKALLTGLSVDHQRRCIRWFPDGRSVLLHDWKSFRRVHVQTGQVQTLFEFPEQSLMWMHAEVSHDGKAVFYSSLLRSTQAGALSTNRLIRRVLATGEEKVVYQVQSDQAGLYGISLSPDGSRLAFMTSSGSDRVLVTMPEGGGELKEIYRAKAVPGIQEPLHWWGATWTKDGRYILATRSVMTEKQSDELVAFPVEGGEPRVLSVMPGQIYNPTASPDGRHILFTSAREDLELWVMRNFLPHLQQSRQFGALRSGSICIFRPRKTIPQPRRKWLWGGGSSQTAAFRAMARFPAPCATSQTRRLPTGAS